MLSVHAESMRRVVVLLVVGVSVGVLDEASGARASPVGWLDVMALCSWRASQESGLNWKCWPRGLPSAIHVRTTELARAMLSFSNWACRAFVGSADAMAAPSLAPTEPPLDPDRGAALQAAEG